MYAHPLEAVVLLIVFFPHCLFTLLPDPLREVISVGLIVDSHTHPAPYEWMMKGMIHHG